MTALEPGAIHTDRLLLRPFVPTDADDLYSYAAIDDVIRYLPWPPRTREESAEHLATRSALISLENDDDALVLAIELPATVDRPSRVIGDMSLFLRSVSNGHAEIGWVLHPDFQGRGYAAEAASAVLELAFDRLGSHRVSANLDPRNTSSARLCARLGMRQEAHLIEDIRLKGEWCDTAIWAILRSEWTTRRPVVG